MPEVKSMVQTYLTDMVCDKCGVGEMTPNATIHATFKETGAEMLYEHACENCGNVEAYPVQYPYLTQEKE
jgi:uncharacterized Zn finger protein